MTGCVGTHPDQPTHADIGRLCYACWTRLRSQLCALPAVAGWLHVFLAAGGAAGERVSGSREDPIPLRVDILDLIGPVAPNPSLPVIAEARVGGSDQAGDPSILDELRAWAEQVEAETGEAWEDRRTVTGAVTYLTGRLSWIVEQPWVDEFDARIRDLSTRAHRVAPWRAEIRRDPTPCETCGRRAIVIHLAEGHSRCEKRAGGCGRVIVWDHRDERRAG